MPSVLAALIVAAAISAAPADTPYFRITVRDGATGRGVPLVELTTTNGITHVTDSAGVIAFREPGLMDAEVHFGVRSHGYRFPADGFGIAGVRLVPTAGASATIELERVNVAERLYRVTGQGIYRDSVLLGDTPPIAEPLLNGRVMGQDSVQTALYRGRIHWFFGDTSRPSYPLGNFSMSGAVSARAGLDPDVGINLTYVVGPDGFSRGMCPIDGQPGPVWCDGMTAVVDAEGRERLLCHYARMKDLGTMHEHGIAIYNDGREAFEPLRRLPLDATLFMRGGGSPIRVADAQGDYIYYCTPFPLVRCPARMDALLDPSQYEAFTCLVEGTRCDAIDVRIERRDGKAVYGWKRDTGLVLQTQQNELISRGLLAADEALIQLTDIETGAPVLAHAGTVAWNDYRRSWIAIVQELWGTSLAGEIWFAEAPALTGPWRLARKIVTHDDYSFYNPAHHPFLDADGGRRIYFQATYSREFSGTKVPTPRYDYNQIMYRLDLADPRLDRTPH